jgi:hypothetical protein
VNALANPEVGKFINEHFCASFQKVATFKIVGNQKQGGNVAAYFCAPDSRVLHVVAGPVNADQMLRESKWVVETVKKAIDESKGDGVKFKAAMRKAHAEKLRQEYGLVVEAVPVDIAPQDPNSALTYNDPTGRPLAPKLPPPPIDGPDVTFRGQAKAAADGMAANEMVRDRAGRAWVLPNGGRVHQIMAAYSLGKIDTVYGTVFENILGEKVSTRPVEVTTPFPWKGRDAVAK